MKRSVVVRVVFLGAVSLAWLSCGGGGGGHASNPDGDADGAAGADAPDGGATLTGCPGTVSCAKECRTPADCVQGQECNGGLCANPLPSLKSYTICQLDLDCPTGDHCQSGVCFHDCVSARDCATGELCIA